MASSLLLIPSGRAGEPKSEKELARQIFDTMLKMHGTQPGHRVVHAKGLVCAGIFVATPEAAKLTMAAPFQGAAVPVTVRFSDGAPDPAVADNSPDAGPRGMAIRFQAGEGKGTDLVAMSHHGFVVGTGEEFLKLQTAIAALDPKKPHPWEIEKFLGAHPLALKFVQENKVIPVSFANEAFFSNDAFIFVNKEGVRQAGRYQILPVAGKKDLSPGEAKAKPANFLMDDMKGRLAGNGVEYRLAVQLPNPGDVTKDPSLVWPADRKTIEVGTITVKAVMPDNADLENEMAFDPTNLTAGIELSDDPLPSLRSRVYSLAARQRQAYTGEAKPVSK